MILDRNDLESDAAGRVREPLGYAETPVAPSQVQVDEIVAALHRSDRGTTSG